MLEAAEVLARCVEAARRLRSQIPWRSGSSKYETGAAALRRDVEPGRLGGAPIDGAGGRWVRKPVAAAVCGSGKSAGRR
jgi:hypothetical protein